MWVEIVATVRKVGGSLMLTIPKEVADAEGIREGTVVNAKVHKKRQSSFGLFPNLGPWEHPEEWTHD
jgi:hypothetical protein